jgi:hypothetical protein
MANTGPARVVSRRPLSARDVQTYRYCDDLSEPLIYAMVIFSPWAFGTTQTWSMWVMNGAGYLLGLLLACKLAIRWRKDYQPQRWDDNGPQDHRTTGLQDHETSNHAPRPPSAVMLRRTGTTHHRPVSGQCSRRLTAALAVLTLAILAYCLVSAVNARATYHREELSFVYHDNLIRWLPHSLDSARTWHAFWSYLAMACSFWAIRDWLLGKSESEERAGSPAAHARGGSSGALLPARLRRLLWVLAVNGGLLAVEGIFQRLEGSGRLLFLVKPRVNPGANTQFGPYAYRANASQYFNLLWPVCLGLWWMLNRSSGARSKTHHLILVCCVVMAACPIISTSRGGALITVGIIALAAFFLVASHLVGWIFHRPVAADVSRRSMPSGKNAPAEVGYEAHRRQDRRSRIITLACLLLFFTAALALGFALGWKTLQPRMTHLSEDFEGREHMYTVARPMAADYPLFGTGPGTFESVFQLYRISTGTYWPAQLHNDWLETRITFGWLGSGLIALAFLAVVLRGFARGGIHGGRRFMILLWLALAGCLVHARYDFPFQIYSIVFLFLVLCAILSTLTRKTLKR